VRTDTDLGIKVASMLRFSISKEGFFQPTSDD